MQNLKRILTLAIFGLLFVSSYAIAQSQGRWDYYTDAGQINSLADDGNYFWASTWGGLVRFNKNDRSYQMYPAETVTSLSKSPHGTIWYTANSNTISHFNGAEWIADTFTNDTNTVPLYPPSTTIPIGIYYLTFDTSGAAVTIGDDRFHPYLLMRYDGASWSKTLLPDSLRSLIGAGPISILIDRNDDLWIIGGEQPAGPDYTRYYYSTAVRIHDTNVTVWRQEDGLPSNLYNGYSIAMDSTGAIWVCRPSGAAKFDGTKWVSYGRPPMKSQPSHVIVDPHGYVTFGGWNGIDQFSAPDWAYSPPFTAGAYTNQLAISSSGELWATSDRGAYRLTKGQWVHYDTSNGLPSNYCYPAVSDSSGDILIGTGQGVARLANGQWTTYAVPTTVTGNQVGGYLGSGGILATDHNNNLFVTKIGDNGNINPGVLRYDGSNWRTFTTQDGLLNDTVLDLACDPAGRMWFANESGVSVQNNGTWNSYTLNDGRNSDRVYQCIAADSAGNIWVGCVHSDIKEVGPPWTRIDSVPEISRITFTQENQPPVWKTYGLKDIPYCSGFGPTNIVASKTGDIWAIGDQMDSVTISVGGLYHFDGTTWHTIDLNDGKPTPTINVGGGATTAIQPLALACADDGAVWMVCNFEGLKSSDGTLLGPIVRYDGKTWQHFGGSLDTLPGVPQNAFALCAETGGRMLASTNFGVIEYDGSNWTLKYAMTPGPVPGDVTGISVAPDRSTWLGTMSNGIAHFIPSASGVSTIPDVQSIASAYPNPFRTSTNISYSLAEDGYVTVALFNSAGIRLASLASENEAMGEHTRTFDGSKLPDGTYRAEIQAIASDGKVTRQSMGLSLIR